MFEILSLVLAPVLPIEAGNQQNDRNAENDIVVTASSRDYPLNGKQFEAALKAFRKHRPFFAPQSRLWFEVSARQGDPSLAGVSLALSDGHTRIPLTIGEDHRIAIPEVAGNSWHLVHVGRPKALRIRPWVLSPNTSGSDLRLGDLQVQCRVGWAIARQSESIFVTGMFDVIGGCASSKIGLYQELGRPIASAILIEGSKQAAIPVWHDTAMRMPTYIKGYTVEARVRIVYR
ncbi:hypothetical protein [Sphingomonas pokkalii]|uniref:Uncharacterized protein n=1 Tax=Sphingomonas pokkalii TaxID=2175090 RepID=A0A2U0SD61_9SPHN|nr:hypothetical protein [Sphingomonas pokkalii]PVX29260.1 hypothetical protein DD559_07890 [Sphingomonas pokkalii]